MRPHIILVRMYLSKHYEAKGIYQVRELIRKYGQSTSMTN